jgi:septum site-determining protein MinD
MAGHIIAITGGKGGVGKSIFATNFAHAFMRETGSKVCLVDLDLEACGDQSQIHAVQGKNTLLEISKYPQSFDRKVVGTLIPTLQTGMAFAGLPSDPLRAQEIEPESLSKFLKAAPNLFSLTVVDCGTILNDHVLKVFESSSLIFLVSLPDVIAVNQTRRQLSKIRETMLPNDMVQVVMNRYVNSSLFPPAAIQKSLGKNVYGVIPEDQPSSLSALMRKVPVVAADPRSALSKAYHDLVRKTIQQDLFNKLAKLHKPSTLNNSSAQPSTAPGKGSKKGQPSKAPTSAWDALKLRVHESLVEQMDMKKMDNEMQNDPKKKALLREKTKKKVIEIINQEKTSHIFQGREDMAQLVKEVLDEALDLGPLEDLLDDPDVSEIMVNSAKDIYIERKGRITLSKVHFSSDQHLLHIIEKIVTPLGRQINKKVPYVDARLEDGSRVHAIIPPLALNGPTITIRKFPTESLTVKDLIKFGSLTDEISDFLRLCVEAHLNIVVSGGTGSGKTTLLNVLSNFVPSNERIITVEDSAELQLGQDHVVRLETRPAGMDGQNAVTIRDLVKQTLRMRPDRIIIGECRGGEALDMLQAMNTGHDGSLTTVHANRPRDALTRLETLVMMADGVKMPVEAIRRQVAGAVDLVIQQSRLSDGSRKITHVTEVIGMQGDKISSQDIFTFKEEGFDKRRKVLGRYVAEGRIPTFVEKLEQKGFKIPRGLFTSGKKAA